MKSLNLLKIYSFFVGFGWSIDAGLIGRFALSEVLLYLALPFLIAANKAKLWNRTAKRYFALLAVFVIAVIVSDLLVDNYFAFFLRGVARPLAIGLNTWSLALLVAASPRLLIYFAFGMLPGACVGFFQESQFNKTGVEGTYKHFNSKFEPILRAFAIISGVFFYRYNRLLAAILLAFPGLLVAVYGSRSGAAIYFLASATIVFLWIIKGQRRKVIEMNFKFIALTVLASTVILTTVYSAYIYSAPRGYLGEMQQSKFYNQSNTQYGVSPIGLIFAGRTAVVGGVLAGMDNPVFGLGSWPNIGEYLLDAILISGDSVSDAQVEAAFMQRAAGHSIIVGTWFNNGIFALAFWIYFCFIMVKVFLYLLRRDNLLTPMFAFIFFELSWHLVFSPLGPQSRLYVALFSALAICFTDKRGPVVKEVEFALLSPFSKSFR